MRNRGFTLIELLIVIAIIAILALIAVPNFLEAQVRAKTSRVHADQRTLATAIEAYSVDWGRPPLGTITLKDADCVDPPVPGPHSFREYVSQSALTTPVAYISSILIDPFWEKLTEKDGRHTYVFHTYLCPGLSDAHHRCFSEFGYTWGLMSRGPEGNQLNGMHVVIKGEGGYAYDPSNGTMSVGAIIRTNKGVFKGRPGQ